MNEPKSLAADAIDKLMAHRLQGESRMIRPDTPPDQVTQEQCAAVIEKVNAYLKENSIPKAVLARNLMIQPSTMSQLLNGKYPADVRPHVIAMERWLDRRAQADSMPEVNTFIWTDVAERILLAARRAMASADAGMDSRISLVWGDPGCGKTYAFKAIVEKSGAIMVTCGVEAMSPAGLLKKIAAELGITHLSHYRAEMFSQIVLALRGTGRLIIIDEIHALLDARDDNSFHTLRRLADESGCPQLWGATCNLIEQLQQREHKREPLGQIVSRIGSQFCITAGIQGGIGPGGRGQPLYSVEEVLKIYGRNELRLTRDAGKFLARFCTNPKLGLLRGCTNLVLHATMMNRLNAKELTVEMLLEAAQILFQQSSITELKKTVHDEIKELKLKLA